QVAARAGPIRDRPLEIRLLGATRAPPGSASARLAKAVKRLHVIVVDESHRAWDRQVIAAADGYPVLTVGSGRAFVRQGGMFGLFEQRGRTVFAANAEAVVSAPLLVSAKVMKIARP